MANWKEMTILVSVFILVLVVICSFVGCEVSAQRYRTQAYEACVEAEREDCLNVLDSRYQAYEACVEAEREDCLNVLDSRYK